MMANQGNRQAAEEITTNNNAAQLTRRSRRSTVTAHQQQSTTPTRSQTVQTPMAASMTSMHIKEEETTPMLIMAPFLCGTIFAERSTNPLKLIIAAREAATFFDASCRGVPNFANLSAKEHALAFSTWAFAIHMG
jgi:hypothetical protein